MHKVAIRASSRCEVTLYKRNSPEPAITIWGNCETLHGYGIHIGHVSFRG